MSDGMFVHQLELGAWDNFITFIGDKASRTCAVVDPAELTMMHTPGHTPAPPAIGCAVPS
jgi:hypothetical protein